MNMRERIAELARKFHSESCYPDALDFEVDAFVDAVLATLSDPTDNMVFAAINSLGGFDSNYDRVRAAFVAAIRKAGER